MQIRASTIVDVAKGFYEAKKKAEGRGKKILYELEENHILISNWQKSRAGNSNAGTYKVIQGLSLKTFEKVQHKFGASDIKMKKITKRSVGTNSWYSHYIGWKSEKLVRHIYKKIRELKDIQRNHPSDPKFRKSVRLININRLLVLLSLHLSS